MPLPGALPSEGPPFKFRIGLYRSEKNLPQDLIGTWEFGPLDSFPDGLEVDLSSLDFYSLRLRNSGRIRLACSFAVRQNAAVSPALVLKLEMESPGSAPKEILSAAVALPTGELTAIERRLNLSRVPPIEWFYLELTNRCNQSCQWCTSSAMKRAKGIMPLDRAKTLLEDIASYRNRNPLLSFNAEIKNQIFLHVMGEPLLHPQFFEILRFGHDLGLDFCLVTNAALLDKQRTKKLLDSGLKAVTLSLNAADEAAFQKAGSPVPYSKLIGQIQTLIRERYRRRSALPRIEIQFLNTRGVNLPDCALVEHPAQVEKQLVFWSSFVRELEWQAGQVPYRYRPDDHSRWKFILEHETIDPELYFEVGQNICLVFKRACNFANALLPAGATLVPASQGQCLFSNAHRTLCIFWDGSCTFCSLDYDNEIDLGNVFEEGIDSIWSGERIGTIRRLMEEGELSEPLCRRCLGTFQPAEKSGR